MTATLAETRAEAFRLLARGVADRRSPFRTPVLGTVSAAGAPSLRTVVLRGFEPAARRLLVHTDRRSAKAGELLATPRAALLFWDPGPQVQIRLEADATLHTDDALAAAEWARTPPGSRLAYGVAGEPGAVVPAPPPSPADPNAGRAQFAVIALVFDRLEWLHLAREGHRRARFAWALQGVTENWLVP